MYYVIQVAPGAEERTEGFIRNQISERLYRSCFHPLRHVRKKFHGEWKDLHEKLLPGYVFITSDSVRELYMELRQVPLLTKVLGRDREEFVALGEREVEWLELLAGAPEAMNVGKGIGMKSVDEAVCRKEDGKILEIELSQVSVSAQDEITILSGPLKNMEGQIRKINLHKRIAEVVVDFMGKKTVVYLGVEMVGRKEERNGAK